MSSVASIILAAGKGTRMKSSHPKVVFPLADKPLIQRVVETAVKAECDLINVVVGYQKETVIGAIDTDCELLFSEQKEQNGTGHAVMVARDAMPNFEGEIFILCGDVPLLRYETLTKMLNEHRAKKAACTVLTAFMDDPAMYGRIVRNADGNVDRIVEFKDANPSQRSINEINTGIYCFNSKDLYSALDKLDNKNAQGEYYLTDTLEILNAENKIVSSAVLDDFIEAAGVNSQEQLSELETAYYDKIKKHFLNNGVVIENPHSVIIGDEVEIENDVIIYANTIIKGKSKIETGAKIGSNCYIIDSIIEVNAILEGFNIVKDSTINQEEIMPFRSTSIEDYE
jgi:UDP-N-acetylglucosamine diphosphorylase/glucosamine-1-phosphate N-acetyltransferase